MTVTRTSQVLNAIKADGLGLQKVGDSYQFVMNYMGQTHESNNLYARTLGSLTLEQWVACGKEFLVGLETGKGSRLVREALPPGTYTAQVQDVKQAKNGNVVMTFNVPGMNFPSGHCVIPTAKPKPTKTTLLAIRLRSSDRLSGKEHNDEGIRALYLELAQIYHTHGYRLVQAGDKRLYATERYIKPVVLKRIAKIKRLTAMYLGRKVKARDAMDAATYCSEQYRYSNGAFLWEMGLPRQLLQSVRTNRVDPTKHVGELVPPVTSWRF